MLMTAMLSANSIQEHGQLKGNFDIIWKFPYACPFKTKKQENSTLIVETYDYIHIIPEKHIPSLKLRECNVMYCLLTISYNHMKLQIHNQNKKEMNDCSASNCIAIYRIHTVSVPQRADRFS